VSSDDSHPGKVPWTEAVLSLLREWQQRAAVSQDAHYVIATRLSRYNLLFGIPVVVFATVVGTSVFATVQENVAAEWQIAVGIISVLAAVLASLQTFLRFQERAEKHRAAAELWASIRREIDQMLALHPEYLAERSDPKTYLDQLRRRMNEVSAQSPEIGDKDFGRAQGRFEGRPAQQATTDQIEPAKTSVPTSG
jgi:type II secretory pathway pseudopilin PulG